MKLSNAQRRIGFGVVLFLAILASRFLPHSANFSPVLAVVMFTGLILIKNKKMAFAITLMALLISDFIIGTYDGILFNYLGYAAIISVGFLLQSKRIFSVLAGGVGSAIIFFILSNFGVWLQSGLYSHSVRGIVECYVMAIPFFYSSLYSTVISSALLLGAYQWARKWIPARV
jgi:hypothetical protein